jgi:hypothetical protein
MTRTVVFLVLFAGCGRIGFTDEAIGPGDLGVDSGVAAIRNTGCWPAWHSGAPALSAPTRIEELVIGSTRLTNPSLSADRLQMFYETDNNGGDLMMTTRAATDQPWYAPRPITELDTTDEESRFSLSADGLTAVFIHRGVSVSELRQTTRARVTEPFSPPTTAPFAALVTPNSKYDAELSPDATRVYFSEMTSPQTIQFAARPQVDAPFSPPTIVTIPNMTTSIADPTLSPDELVMVFSESDTSLRDLSFALRDSRDAHFGPSMKVPNVNSANDEGDAALSSDGCELVFSSNRVGRELWVAHVQ